MSRPRIYATDAERHRAFRERRKEELEALRRKIARHPRHPDDVYLTPPEFAAVGLERVTIQPATILDVGAGVGVWGRAARARWPEARIVGVELREVAPAPEYDEWVTGDFAAIAPTLDRFDLAIGNPPHSHAETFVRAGLSLLTPKGELLFFLRLAFSEGQSRARGLYREFPLAELSVCDRRPKSYGAGGGMTAFGFFRWQEGVTGETRMTTAVVSPRAP